MEEEEIVNNTHKKILVADDNAILLRVMEFQLKNAGFTVSIASDGLEALELFLHDEFDCIITDLRMPKLSGWELLERVRITNANIPVIVITAFGDGELSLGSGAFDFINKPFSREEMLLALDRALGLNRQSHSTLSRRHHLHTSH